MALQAEAAALLDELDRSGIFSDIGPLEVTGSYISGLMCWRDLDVGLLVGPDYRPRDVLHLISQIMVLPGVVGFDYRDERGGRSPTGLVKEERYHIPLLLERDAGIWRLDLALWLHDLHKNVTAWHEALRDSITDEQRAAVLRIKDVWFRRPSYPDEIGGSEIYTAVIDDGVQNTGGVPRLAHRSRVARRDSCVIESGAQRQLQVAGFAEDAAQREHEPGLRAAAEVGNLVRRQGEVVGAGRGASRLRR